jgi:HSP20 family protein
MPIVRWEPFRDLLSLQERMNRLFEDRLARVRGEEPMTGSFAPPVDIYETEQAIVLEVDVPGLKLEDLDIRVENNTLTIRGERQQSTEVKEENYHRVERYYGSFTRSFAVPNQVDPQKIEATYENGVLRLTMAKREESKPKQIKVEVARK